MSVKERDPVSQISLVVASWYLIFILSEKLWPFEKFIFRWRRSWINIHKNVHFCVKMFKTCVHIFCSKLQSNIFRVHYIAFIGLLSELFAIFPSDFLTHPKYSCSMIDWLIFPRVHTVKMIFRTGLLLHLSLLNVGKNTNIVLW